MDRFAASSSSVSVLILSMAFILARSSSGSKGFVI
jgi:hypothetical protein